MKLENKTQDQLTWIEKRNIIESHCNELNENNRLDVVVAYNELFNIKPESYYTILYIENEFAGFVYTENLKKYKRKDLIRSFNSNDYHLNTILVKNNYQNKGYSRILLDEHIKYLLEQNLQNIYTTCNTKYNKAINIISKSFKMIDEIIHMEKNMNKSRSILFVLNQGN